MEAAVLKGEIKQGGLVDNVPDNDVLYIHAVTMIVDKSHLFGLLGNTDVHYEDIIMDHCIFCGKEL